MFEYEVMTRTRICGRDENKDQGRRMLSYLELVRLEDDEQRASTSASGSRLRSVRPIQQGNAADKTGRDGTRRDEARREERIRNRPQRRFDERARGALQRIALVFLAGCALGVTRRNERAVGTKGRDVHALKLGGAEAWRGVDPGTEQEYKTTATPGGRRKRKGRKATSGFSVSSSAMNVIGVQIRRQNSFEAQRRVRSQRVECMLHNADFGENKLEDSMFEQRREQGRHFASE
ncbi:hypothetical protein C8R45DRAFT_1084565 [Mycena sanguinolenta]|nr:hypothetical protein C8R45DRAFT_1084565 [Mycena sanguinolenta]